MEAAGIMLALMIGIVVIPIVAYIVWRLLRYVRKLPRKVQRITCISVLSIVLILCVGTFHIVDKGYCIRDGKYFSEYSEEKMINQAIIWLIGEQDRSISAHNERYGNNEIIPYKNIDEFKKMNPDCCYIHIGDVKQESGPVSFYYKLNGDFYGYVLLDYQEIWMEEKNKINTRKAEWKYGVNRCGKLFDVPLYFFF